MFPHSINQIIVFWYRHCCSRRPCLNSLITNKEELLLNYLLSYYTSSQQLGNKRTGNDQNVAKPKGDEAGAAHKNDASGKVKKDPVALMKKDLDELREAVVGNYKRPASNTYVFSTEHINFHVGVS